MMVAVAGIEYVTTPAHVCIVHARLAIARTSPSIRDSHEKFIIPYFSSIYWYGNHHLKEKIYISTVHVERF